MFIGVNDGYIDFVDNRLLYAIDTKIHHVESWGSFAENFQGDSDDSGEDSDDSDEDKDKSEYRKKIVQWGTKAVEYANWKWKHS